MLPTPAKGQLPSRVPPFVSPSGRLYLLRRVSPCSPPHHPYRNQLAPSTYEGLISFLHPTAVSPPGRLFLLRRVFPCSPPHHSYSVQLAPCYYEGYLPVSYHTLRTASSKPLLLRRVSFLLASHHSYPCPAGSVSYEGYLPFPRLTLRTASSLLPAPTKSQLPSRLPPSVSSPGRLCLLRRVFSCSPPYHSYRVQLASYTYEGLASFSRPTIRIRARQGFQMPRQKEKAGHFAQPLLKDYILCSNLHSKFCFTPTAPASAQRYIHLPPLHQPQHSVISIYPHCASLSTVIYPFSSTAPITQETL